MLHKPHKLHHISNLLQSELRLRHMKLDEFLNKTVRWGHDSCKACEYGPCSLYETVHISVNYCFGEIVLMLLIDIVFFIATFSFSIFAITEYQCRWWVDSFQVRSECPLTPIAHSPLCLSSSVPSLPPFWAARVLPPRETSVPGHG